jgi:SOS-response transcriptional repressor LexA
LPSPHCPDKSGPAGSPTDTLRKDSTLPPVTSKKSIIFLGMVKIAGFFKGLKAYTADIREFLQETGYLPADLEPAGESKRISVLSWTQAGSWQEIVDNAQYGEYVESDAKGIFALRVRGESMEAEFHEGDIIGYR